jgi:flavin-dependent dehydrogenase
MCAPTSSSSSRSGRRIFDVVVVGGGPAGLAVGGALGRRGRSVAVLERTTYERSRAGETLDPETGPLLKTLGAWDHMSAFMERQLPHRAVLSAWGGDELEDKPAILHPLGEGRHVERARFDETMSAWAESCGAAVRRSAGTCVVRRLGDAFRVDPARGEPVEGCYFVDASGRGAPASAKLAGRRWLAVDRQVALVTRTKVPGDLGFDLLLEAAEEGWWYSVPQPDGALVVALITDSDLVPAGDRRDRKASFGRSLARTTHTAARCRGASDDSPVRIVRADSGLLMPERGDDWSAVGDAAMSTDPIAGNGVARALRSAVEAVERIDARLRGETPPPTAPLQRRFVEYLDRRAGYYEIEARWTEAPFWARRRPGAWKDAPITLDPAAMLRRGASPSPAALAPVEALVPPRAIASTLDSVAAATPAHALLSKLRETAPLGDHRLLVGLQRLLATGALTDA